MKYCSDLTVKAVERINEKYVLLRLTQENPLPEMQPGQFVEVRVDDSPNTFLRRPISINDVDRVNNELHLLVAVVGDGTRHLAQLTAGSKLNVMYPLGNGFNVTSIQSRLLVGGGVGVAPLLYLGRTISEMGGKPTFLLGARTKHDLLLLDKFKMYGEVYVTTEDGSEGERGFVTDHSIWQKQKFSLVSTCGPMPMMKAVARLSASLDTECELSLENKMACGLGACLCCVEKTNDKGNVCVCTEGPVFDAKRLIL